MKQKIKVTVGIIVAIAVIALIPLLLQKRINAEPPAPEAPQITHAQDTWMRALEWCESRGIPGAVNPKDRDGTPSYSSWQFKPSTLDYYAERYGVATTSVMDREVQKAVLEQMLLHYDEINWRQQFPDCINRKIGMPPK